MIRELEDNIFPFKFKCVRCGNCCTMMSKGVPLYYMDLKRIAESMDLLIDDFVRNYCELAIHHINKCGANFNIPVLHLKISGTKCIFYNKGCSIHAVKPYNCSAAPIISLLFQSINVVDYFKNNCKGYGIGTYYSKERIVQNINHEIELEKQELELIHGKTYGEILCCARTKNVIKKAH